MFLTDSTSACLLPTFDHKSFSNLFTYWTDFQISRKSSSSLLWNQMSRHFLQQRVDSTPRLKRLVKYRTFLKFKEIVEEMSHHFFFWIKTILLHISIITVLSPYISHLYQVKKRVAKFHLWICSFRIYSTASSRWQLKFSFGARVRVRRISGTRFEMLLAITGRPTARRASEL